MDYRIAFVLLALAVSRANIAAAGPIADLIENLEFYVKDGHTQVSPKQLVEAAGFMSSHNLNDKMSAVGGLMGLVKYAVLDPAEILTHGRIEEVQQVQGSELARLYAYLRPMFVGKEEPKPRVAFEWPKLDAVVHKLRKGFHQLIYKDDYANLLDEYRRMEQLYRSSVLDFGQSRLNLAGLAAYFNHPAGRVMFPIVKAEINKQPEEITKQIVDALAYHAIDI